MCHRLLLRVLAACLSIAFFTVAHATEHIYLLPSPGMPLNAGFGELTPGPHDLSVTFQSNGTRGPVYASLWDGSGSTIWTANWVPGATSMSCVAYGVSEDTLGCAYGCGWFYEWDSITGYGMMTGTFSVTISNVTLPCMPVQECACNSAPMGYMGMGAWGCPGTDEGGMELLVSDIEERTPLSVTVRRGCAGTLTITSDDTEVLLFDMNGDPLVPLHLDFGSADTIQFEVGLATSAGADTRLRARFVPDNGSLDTEDVYDITIDIGGFANPPFSAAP